MVFYIMAWLKHRVANLTDHFRHAYFIDVIFVLCYKYYSFVDKLDKN